MQNKYELSIDLQSGESIMTKAKYRTGDTNSAKMEVTLTNEGLVQSILGEDITWNFEKADHTHCTQNMTNGVSIVDPENGVLLIVFENQTLACPGLVRASITFAKEGVISSTIMFAFTVNGTVNGGDLSINYITAVETKISEWQAEVDAIIANGTAGGTAVAASVINGNIKINGIEDKVYDDGLVVSEVGANTARLNDMYIDVKHPPLPLVACKVDGTTDDTIALQAISDFVGLNGGGTIYIPKGTCVAKLELDSNVKLKGAGWLKTFIKCPDNAGIDNLHGVVQSRGFDSTLNLWKYYAPYPIGLCMGIQLQDICIDGNRANNTTGNGLCIYGGKFLYSRLGVINTAHNGIWNQCGNDANSTQGNDMDDFINMHESSAEQVFICNTNARGWYYNGPNDSYINNISIKSTGGSALWVDSNSWCLKIGTLHMYFANLDPANTDTCQCFINVDNIMADRLNIDTPTKDGLVINSNLCVINLVNVLVRNVLRAGSFYAVRILGNRNTIDKVTSYQSYVTSTTGTLGGGDVHIDGEFNVINNLTIQGMDTEAAACYGLVLKGHHNAVNSCMIDGYFNNVGSMAVAINGDMIGNYIKGTITNCHTGVYYDNSTTALQTGKGNVVDISTGAVTNALAIATTAVTSDNLFKVYDGSTTRYKTLCNTQSQNLLSLDLLPLMNPDPLTCVLDMSKGNTFRTISLASNFLLNLPINSTAGDMLILAFNNITSNPIVITTNAGFTLKSIVNNTRTLAINEVFAIQIVCLSNNGNWVETGSMGGSATIDPDVIMYQQTGNKLNGTIHKFQDGLTTTGVCYGDSITWGQIPTLGGQAVANYPAVLQTKLRKIYGNNNINIVNAGNPGMDTVFGLANIDAQVINTVPGFCLLMWGTNDCTGRLDLVTFKDNIRQMVKKCLKANIEVLLMNCHPIFKTDDFRKNRQQLYARAVTEIANELDVSYINMFNEVSNLYLEGIEINNVLQPDMVHFDQYKYYYIADIVLNKALYINEFNETLEHSNDDLTIQIYHSPYIKTDILTTAEYIIGTVTTTSMLLDGTTGTYLRFVFFNKKQGKDLLMLSSKSSAGGKVTILDNGVAVNNIIDFYSAGDSIHGVPNTIVENLSYGLHIIEVLNTNITIGKGSLGKIYMDAFLIRNNKKLQVEVYGTNLVSIQELYKPLIRGTTNLIDSDATTTSQILIKDSFIELITGKTLKLVLTGQFTEGSGFSWLNNYSQVGLVSGYMFLIYGGNLILYISNGSAYAQIAQVTTTVANGIDHDFIVTHTSDGVITIFIDGVQLLQFTDSNETSGYIGLYSGVSAVGTTTLKSVEYCII